MLLIIRLNVQKKVNFSLKFSEEKNLNLKDVHLYFPIYSNENNGFKNNPFLQIFRVYFIYLLH